MAEPNLLSFEKLELTGRDSTTTKDGLVKNLYYEEEARRIVKRPGVTLDTSVSGACGSGLYTFEDTLHAVVDDEVLTVATGSSFSAYETRSTAPEYNSILQKTAFALSFNGALYVMGGEGSGVSGTRNYVYKSTDGGATWGLLTSTAWAEGGRRNFALCVHDGKMWVLGGDLGTTYAETYNNDVYSSYDGATWATVRADGVSNGFTKMYTHKAVSYDGKLWVVGGAKDNAGTGASVSEVWSSYDGFTWTLVTNAPGWSARGFHSLFVHDGKMWIYGGGSGGTYLNDLWYTTDGASWTEANSAALPEGKRYALAFSKNGSMYIGFGGESVAPESDLHKSSDNGVTWSQVHPDQSAFDSSSSDLSGVFHSDGALYIFEVVCTLSTNNVRYVWRSTLDETTQTIGTIDTLPAGVGTPSETLCEQVDFAEIQLTPSNVLFLKTRYNAWEITNGALTQITDADYPSETVPGAVHLDGYIFVMTPKSEIHNSALEDPTAWSALDFITAEMEPDKGVAIAKHLNYVVALGEWTTEFFYDAQNAAGSPLSRLEASSLWIGCAAARSVVNVGNNLIWVAKDRTKGRFVMALEGLQAQRISTPAVDRILTSSTLATVRSYPVMLDGHLFYVLNLIDDGLTLVFDISTRKWAVWTTLTAAAPKSVTSITRSGETATATVATHGYAEGDTVTIAGANQSDYNGDFVIHDLTSSTFQFTVRNSPATPATGTITAKNYTESHFLGTYFAHNGGTNYLQDPDTGDVYAISSSAYRDASAPIRVQARTRDHDFDTLIGKFIAWLRIQTDQEAAFVSLRWTDDDYQTYSKFRDKWMNGLVHFDRLGKMRRRAFDIAHVGNTAFRAAYLEVSPEGAEH